MLLQLYVLKDSWDINVPLIGSAGTVMSHNKTNRKKTFFSITPFQLEIQWPLH